MASTVSVAKGCFVYKNGFKPKQKDKNKQINNLYEQKFISETWYEAYKCMWSDIERKIDDLRSSTYQTLMKELVDFVKDCYNNDSFSFSNEIIPCATLLTGVNQPDHLTQFEALKSQLLADVTSHVAILYSQDSATIKHVIENMVSSFMNADLEESKDDDDDSPSKRNHCSSIKKSRCNMNALREWFIEKYDTKKTVTSPLKRMKSRNSLNQLVVIIPDFENYNSDTLQDLILILSTYTPSLPFVLIFGVATSVSALHKNFPFHVSSKLYIQVFQSHSSTEFLNKILDKIFFNADCPFHLGEKAFKVLLDIFLFYDFSVIGFIQGIKHCMMEHYYSSNVMSLCCPKKSIKEAVSKLTDDDLENVRRLMSFRPYVESEPPAARIALLTDDAYFRNDLCKTLKKFHYYLKDFHLALRILNIFTCELPNSPLGKQLRELYFLCISTSIVESSDYKQSMKLLEFQSKNDFVKMLRNCIDLLSSNDDGNSKKKSKTKSRVNKIRERFSHHFNAVQNADMEVNNKSMDVDTSMEEFVNFDRKKLKERMLNASKIEKGQSDFEIARKNFLEYLTDEFFSAYLKPSSTQTFYEIFIFHDIYKVKKNIVGTPRASIHTALVNPRLYLQCKCCILPREESILQTLPDISIAYKLYLECGKLINLYDWLQAFVTVVDPVVIEENDDDERTDIQPEIQARFTRAVSELQFLGFIKSSKRKTDHVTRLTW